MKTLFNFIFVLFTLIGLLSCDSNEPQTASTLSLTVEDVNCTEAWLQLKSSNIQLPNNISLLVNGAVKKTFTLSTQDSLLYIDSLLPNQSYKVLATLQQSNNASNELTFTTLDTTSHNFTWQIFEFGEIVYPSYLFDVSIINENDIWAVGQIYMNDSLGNPDPECYNAAHWDGNDWVLKKIKTNACGGVDYPPIRAIFTFSPNDILFAHADGSISHFNGTAFTNDCSLITQLNGSINKIWGMSRNNFYVVSGNGFIGHFKNGIWTKIESGTDLILSDIVVNNLGEIFICGSNLSYGTGIILKSSNGNNFSTFVEGAIIPESLLFKPKLYGSFLSIWIDPNNTLYSGGDILFQNKYDKWTYVKSLPENFIGGNQGAYYRGYITKVRGNASNDLWIIGDRNTIRHFNGVNWQQIGLPYDPQSLIDWMSMHLNGKIKAIVGNNNRKAIMMILK